MAGRQRSLTALCHTASVWSTLGLLWLAFQHPRALPAAYSLLLVALLAARAVLYRRKHWHHYCLDFCYYGNALLLVLLWVRPDDPRLFLVCFANANGAMLWGAVLFRNTAAFHSLDKMTSCYIHLVPALVVLVLRWGAAADGPCLGARCAGDEGLAWQVLAPAAGAAAHGGLYVLWVWLVPHPRLRASDGYANSFVYLSAHFVRLFPRMPLLRWYARLPNNRRFACYAAVQLFFTVLASLLALPMYHSQPLNVGALLAVALGCTWRGGTFAARAPKVAAAAAPAPASAPPPASAPTATPAAPAAQAPAPAAPAPAPAAQAPAPAHGLDMRTASGSPRRLPPIGQPPQQPGTM